ncbi:MAG TPA: GNAT family N-acetyltransferase [Polyangiaceae bacterium]|nr:GNAT family N-acetyltransferase [Polyangiaceae bacterium]
MQLSLRQGSFSSDFVDRLCACAETVFASASSERSEIVWRLEKMPDAVVHYAEENDVLIGFKIAYATRSRRLYSWLGGVLPDYRRRGVGKALMDYQHAWAKERGYLNVETGTIRNNVPMMLLNLRSGFEIIGTYSRAGKARVLLAKRL